MQARLLLRSGYDTRAIAVALRQEMAQRTDEAHSVESASGRDALATGVTSLAVGAGSLWWLWQDINSDLLGIALAALSVIAPTMAIRSFWTYTHRHQPDGVWSRMASGRFGRALFRVAGIGLPQVSAPALEGGEATVIAVGDRARLAFAALPPAQREVLRDVPALVTRLEGDALRLRAAPPTPAQHARLEAVMAALELVRLDLLKAVAAHAGPTEITAVIERVREIGRRVDAMGETERLLDD